MEDFIKLMVPDESPSPSPLAPVATLAFIDLETTGLPFDVGQKNVQITELSIVAIDRTDFESDPSMRITNKINIYIRPRTPVSHGAMSVTGLYNDLLERQKPFDSTISEMLTLFFKRLRSPICLLAHNGDLFDFPVLQAELKRLSLAMPIDITCADTLLAFRSVKLLEANIAEQQLLPAEPKKTEQLVTEVKAIKAEEIVASTICLDEDKLLNDDIELFCGLSDNAFFTNDEIKDTILQPLPQGHGETTPVKKTKSNSPPHLNYKNKISKQNRYLSMPKQKLFDYQVNSTKLLAQKKSLNGTSPPKNGKKSYSLENLYTHFFGEEAQGSHHALTDCLNLCKVSQKVEDFLPWIDENQRLFTNVKAMW